MALIKVGNGISDIRGSIAGNIFTRDKSGLHIVTTPRTIKNCSEKQKLQRSAFTQARDYSVNNRTVSYNIYRALNGLDMAPPPLDYPPVH